MITGKMEHYASRDGDRTVHVIPEDGVFNVYYQQGDSPMLFAFGWPIYQKCDKRYYTWEEAIEMGWDNFDEYPELFEEEETDDEL
jgi:hypothetical protein